MRKITSLLPLQNHLLQIVFDNGIKKLFDMKPYLHLPVFQALQKEENFLQVENRGSFIEWTMLQVDLSADTLWHDGK